MSTHSWLNFDNGNTIGQIGSEGGLILRDEENTLGARITLEGKNRIAPFAITLGIYGVMFHTDYFSTQEISIHAFNTFKQKIETFINHCLMYEKDQGAEWYKQRNILLDALIT